MEYGMSKLFNAGSFHHAYCRASTVCCRRDTLHELLDKRASVPEADKTHTMIYSPVCHPEADRSMSSMEHNDRCCFVDQVI